RAAVGWRVGRPGGSRPSSRDRAERAHAPRIARERGLRALAHTPARVNGKSRATLRAMTTTAFVFPGQGSQSVGMGQALSGASPAAAAIFADADAALGESISSLAFEGPAELLDRTENAQPALLATSIAYLAALRERGLAAGDAPLTPAFA